MGRCDNCGYYWADLNDEGDPITHECCHWTGPDEWAPCAQDDSYDYTNEDYEDWREQNDYDWRDDQEYNDRWSDDYDPDWILGGAY